MFLTGQAQEILHTKPTLDILKSKLPLNLQQLIENYSILFEVPTKLPSHRSHDHKIPLTDETKAVKIRPYRYLLVQKK